MKLKIFNWDLDSCTSKEKQHLIEKDGRDILDSEKLPYPKSVFFIISNEFCERFCFYGLKAILTLYLRFVLGYAEDVSVVIYHTFTMLCYFTPLIGSIIADTLLGKYRTIFYISIVYAFGCLLLAFSSAPIPNYPQIPMSMLSLFLIALGTGGIKPCVSAFGGDQFKRPEQDKELEQFFSVFYFSINAGSFISTFVTPILREDVQCFGETTCYPFAFGLPSGLFVISIIIFVSGKSMYKMHPPEGNIILDTVKCIGYAIKKKVTSKEKRDSWLDYADDKYSPTLIKDVKIVLGVLLLYIPLPMFWALFDQQGSNWTFMATRMDGTIFNTTIKPDQMQVVNPILILAMIPLFQTIIYPLLAKCNVLVKPLQRIVVGGLLAGLAFVCSGFVQMAIEKSYPIIPGPTQVRFEIVNGLDCPLSVTKPWAEILDIANAKPRDELIMDPVDLPEGKQITFNFFVSLDKCVEGGKLVPETDRFDYTVTPVLGKVIPLIVSIQDGNKILIKQAAFGELDKTENGNPKVRFYYQFVSNFIGKNITLKGRYDNYEFLINSTDAIGTTDYQEVAVGKYQIFLPDGNEVTSSSSFYQGAVYDILIKEKDEKCDVFEVTQPNNVHMLWLLPQYIIMTSAEIMFSISGLEFSFSQAPKSMKSLIMASYNLTVAFGNVIIIIITEVVVGQKKSTEAFIFSAMIVVDMAIFAILATRCYTYRDPEEEEDEAYMLQPEPEIEGLPSKVALEDVESMIRQRPNLKLTPADLVDTKKDNITEL